MDLKANLTLSDLNPKKIIAAVAPYRNLLVLLIVIGVIGYTGLQLTRIISIAPTPVGNQSEKAAPSLKLKSTTVTQLRSLHNPAEGSSTSVPVGKTDPFSL